MVKYSSKLGLPRGKCWRAQTKSREYAMNLSGITFMGHKFLLPQSRVVIVRSDPPFSLLVPRDAFGNVWLLKILGLLLGQLNLECLNRLINALFFVQSNDGAHALGQTP